MLTLDTEAIVCGVLHHGEHGAIVRMMTPNHGLVAAYVRGGRGRRMRPLLIPGNLVSAQLRSRTDAQLPQATIELIHSRAAILSEPIASAAIEWVTVLLAATLAERQPYPRLYEAASGLFDAIEAAPAASAWGAALAGFERLVSAELGYGTPPGVNLAAGNRSRDWGEIVDSLDRSGEHLFREALAGRYESIEDSRARLVHRLRRLR
jgi:DNA repair protein RecO (recombination protein O)